MAGDIWLIEGARLELYGMDGATNLIIRPAAHSYYEQESQRVRSPEGLRVATGDGRMSIEGVGFDLDMVTERLVVSNQVRAAIHKQMLQIEVPDGMSPLPPAAPRDQETDFINVQSDSLEYEAEQALFVGNVRIEDARGWMTSRRLSIELSIEMQQPGRIVAQDDVAVESGPVQAQASQVIYDPQRERLELQGNPMWQTEGRSGRANQIVLDRVEQRVEASGDVEMDVLARTLMPRGSWPDQPVPDLEDHDIEERFVRVRADRFTFGPDASQEATNLAVFQGGVLVEEESARLTCHMLTVETVDPDQEARVAIASENVVFERADGRVTCQRAVYDASQAALTLEGGTAWHMQGSEGRSEWFHLDLAQGRYQASGGVTMWLAREALGDALAIVDSEWFADESEPSDSNRKIQIQSEQFEYQMAMEENEPAKAVYDGGVEVREGERFVMHSDILAAQLAPGTNQLQQLVADRNVELRILDPTGHRLARGDRLQYRADTGSIELTGEDGVEFYVVTPSGVSRGMGRRAVYDHQTEMLELDGRPLITTPEGELTGDVVRMDRAHGTLSASGAWRIRLPVGAHRMPQLPSP